MDLVNLMYMIGGKSHMIPASRQEASLALERWKSHILQGLIPFFGKIKTSMEYGNMFVAMNVQDDAL